MLRNYLHFLSLLAVAILTLVSVALTSQSIAVTKPATNGVTIETLKTVTLDNLQVQLPQDCVLVKVNPKSRKLNLASVNCVSGHYFFNLQHVGFSDEVPTAGKQLLKLLQTVPANQTLVIDSDEHPAQITAINKLLPLTDGALNRALKVQFHLRHQLLPQFSESDFDEKNNFNEYVLTPEHITFYRFNMLPVIDGTNKDLITMVVVKQFPVMHEAPYVYSSYVVVVATDDNVTDLSQVEQVLKSAHLVLPK